MVVHVAAHGRERTPRQEVSLARGLLALFVPLITLFIALPRPATGGELRITLTWTTPGDDGWVGLAAQYDVRVSRYEINETNFHKASKVAGFTVPGAVGGTQAMVVTGLTPGVSYYFAVKTRDDAGNWSSISNLAYWSDPLLDTGPSTTFATLEFSGAQPNPARTQTRFTMTLPMRDMVEVEVFDVTGRQVRTLARGEEPAGAHDVSWDLADDSGRRLPVGTYLVRARIGMTTFTRRVSVVR
jgi:hypothetical protein